jgi:hypothetical protein
MYARSRNALIVESFFDQIYDDLETFWGVDVLSLQRIVRDFSPKISIRTGVVDAEMKNSYVRLQETMGVLKNFVEEEGVSIPDLDIPVNVDEEPAMLMPWEEVDTALQFARPILVSAKDVFNNFTPPNDTLFVNSKFDPEWKDGRKHRTSAKWFGPRPFWSLVKPACPPNSRARLEPLMHDIWHLQGHTTTEHEAAGLLPLEPPAGTLDGYVKNWTSFLDTCRRPELQGLHGAFVAPESMSVTQKLFPIFSSTKMSMSSEVLIPSSSDYNISHTSAAPIP